MNENYDELLSYYSTRQLVDNLTSYGCKCIESNRLYSIKRKFYINKFHEYNIFKNSIKINHDFSEELIRALGSHNTQYIYNIDDPLYRILFSGLVEYEALRQLHIKDYHILGCLLLSCESARYDLMPDRFIWTLDHKTTHTSVIEFIQNVLNLSWLDALATLADILGMNYENIFFFSSTGSIPETVAASGGIPGTINLPRQSGEAIRTDLTQVMSPSGQSIGGFVQYRAGEHLLCLPATPVDGVLSIGKCKPPAFFLNQDEMDRNQSDIIIFCADIRTATALNNALKECQKDIEGFIVTGHLGTDLSILPWNYLYNHPVVFVPAPSTASFASVKAYREYILGASKERFSVASNLLLHAAPPCDLQRVADQLDDITEAELLRTAVYINGIERPSVFLRNLANNARGYEEFVQWGQEAGIFRRDKSMDASASAHPASELPPANQTMMPPTAFQLTDVTLYHSFRPGNLVILLGAKGAGKTQCALSACHALLAGNIPWPFFAGCLDDVGNIAYVDAETPYDEFCANLKQHHLDMEKGKHFFGLSKFAPELPGIRNSFSLTDQSFRDGLRRYLMEHQCRFVFLDNLTALMGDSVHQGKFAQDVLKWVEELQKSGLCVVLVHHKSEFESASPNSDKARGSQIFTIRARTIIALLSSNEILKSDLGTPAVREAAKQDGLTVGIRYNASKPAPVLEKKTFWLHLPLGASNWQFLAATGVDEEEIPFELQQNEDLTEVEIAPESPLRAFDTEHEFSPDERSLVKVLEGGSAKREAIQQKLRFGEDKTRALLKSLIERGVVIKEGQGKATYYTLKSAS